MKTTKKLVLTAMMVSLAVTIDLIMKMIPILDMPSGGSFNLNMLPLFFLAFIVGPVYGIIGGVAFGLLNFFLDGYGFSWASIFLDYTIAFGVIGIAGFFKSALKGNYIAFVGSIILCAFLRFLSSTASGILMYVDELGFKEALVLSAEYNGWYMLASTAGVIAIGLLVYKPVSKYAKANYLK